MPNPRPPFKIYLKTGFAILLPKTPFWIIIRRASDQYQVLDHGILQINILIL